MREKLRVVREGRRATVRRDAEGRAARGVLVMRREFSDGKVWGTGERASREGRCVWVRSREVRVGKRSLEEFRVVRGLERRERVVRFGSEVRGDRQLRERRRLDSRERILSEGVFSVVVRVVRALEVAERVVKEGKEEVRSTI